MNYYINNIKTNESEYFERLFQELEKCCEKFMVEDFEEKNQHIEISDLLGCVYRFNVLDILKTDAKTYESMVKDYHFHLMNEYEKLTNQSFEFELNGIKFVKK